VYHWILNRDGTFTVGLIDSRDNWCTDSDHTTEAEASRRVNYLNGGGGHPYPPVGTPVVLCGGGDHCDELAESQLAIDLLHTDLDRLRAASQELLDALSASSSRGLAERGGSILAARLLAAAGRVRELVGDTQ